MLTPRHAIGAGLVLVALAVVLATGGHGLWILFAFFWFAGPRSRSCHGRRRWDEHTDVRRHEVTDDAPPAPDPTRDRHEAFPGSR